MEQTIMADIFTNRKGSKRFIGRLRKEPVVDNVDLIGTVKKDGALHVRLTRIDRTGDICPEDWLHQLEQRFKCSDDMNRVKVFVTGE